MQTKRNHEGYLLIQHDRQSPGVPDAAMARNELPPGSGRGTFEAPTYTCHHCGKVQVINPLRTRERGYCPKCDHYLCDECELVRVLHGGQCTPFRMVMDQAAELAANGRPVPSFERGQWDPDSALPAHNRII